MTAALPGIALSAGFCSASVYSAAPVRQCIADRFARRVEGVGHRHNRWIDPIQQRADAHLNRYRKSANERRETGPGRMGLLTDSGSNQGGEVAHRCWGHHSDAGYSQGADSHDVQLHRKCEGEHPCEGGTTASAE